MLESPHSHNFSLPVYTQKEHLGFTLVTTTFNSKIEIKLLYVVHRI